MELAQLPPRAAFAMSDEERSRRYRRAKDEEIHTLMPYIKWLADADLMWAKSTIIHRPDGTVEHVKEYPPGVKSAVDEMTAMMKKVQWAIWAYHFPGIKFSKEQNQ